MITYAPPKSRIWGHRVGRLMASQLLERGLRFLNEQCTVIQSSPSTLCVSAAAWDTVPVAVDAIEDLLDARARMEEGRGPEGAPTYSFHWTVPPGKLPAVAQWFDSARAELARGQTVAMCSTFWLFRWLSNSANVESSGESPDETGGHFGIHLGHPHYVTTKFAFRDIAHYASIKAYLADIGLVALSDTHVRPRIA